MNTRFKTLTVLLVIAALALSGCGIVRLGGGVISQYHALIETYQNGQMAAANGASCLALNFSEIQIQVGVLNNYLVADIAKTKAYREALAEFGNKFAQQQGAYAGPNGQPLQPGQLDLGEMAKQGALPSDMGLTIQVYATTFAEAPLPPVPPEPTINVQRIVDEKINMSFACIKDWNDAVKVYNVERNKVPGDVVGRLAEYLHVKDLPQTLPYFTLAGPTTPPQVPTLAVP